MMPSTAAKSSVVSNTSTVFRSGNAIFELLFAFRFKLLLVHSENLLQRTACLVNRHLAHDAALESSKTRLLRTLDGDQIKPVPSVGRVSDADREVERGFEVVAGVELFERHRVGRLIRRGTLIDNRLDDSQRRLETKIHFFPVEV